MKLQLLFLLPPGNHSSTLGLYEVINIFLTGLFYLTVILKVHSHVAYVKISIFSKAE